MMLFTSLRGARRQHASFLKPLFNQNFYWLNRAHEVRSKTWRDSPKEMKSCISVIERSSVY